MIELNKLVVEKDEEGLIEALKELDNSYYNDDEQVSDDIYDNYKYIAQELFPNNPYFNDVGAPTKSEEKIKHDVPMLSISKGKTIEDIKSWINKIGYLGKLLIEPKLDGISATCRYENGHLAYIATRGDGKQGQDITHIQHFVDIPKRVNKAGSLEVRGELYLPKNNPIYKEKLRNNCSGLVNRKEDMDNLKYVKFGAYQLISHDEYVTVKEEHKIIEEELVKLGFKVIDWKVIDIKALQQIYDDYLNNYRNTWEYETDGLVITVNDKTKHKELDSKWESSHHHQYNIAWKPPSQSARTILRDIEWNVSRHGSVVPTAILDPVEINGVKIQRASLNNYVNVKELDAREGSEVILQRANDVIPFVESIKTNKEGKELIPDYCPSCGTLLHEEGVHLICLNKDCSEQQIQKITFWCEQCEMDGVAESTIRALYENGIINKIIDLYDIDDTYYNLNIEGFGKKKIDNLLEQINKSCEMTIAQFIKRLGIHLVGEKAVKKLGIKTIEDFINFNDLTYKVGHNLIEFKNNNKNMIDELLGVIKIINDDKKELKGDKGLVVMTGTGHHPRKVLEEKLTQMGYTIGDRIGKDVNYLVCADLNSTSSKMKKARDLGIEIVTYEQFFN